MQEVLKVDVPDTVLLKYQRPYAWFHSEDSIVRKKIRVQELTPEAILQVRYLIYWYAMRLVCTLAG